MDEQSPAWQKDRIARIVAENPAGVSTGVLLRAVSRISRRTLNRRLAALVDAEVIERRGEKRGAFYFPSTRRPYSSPDYARATDADWSSQLLPRSRVAEPLLADSGPLNGFAGIKLSHGARRALDYVSGPIGSRKPVGYQPRVLDDYQPNRTPYLSAAAKAHLHTIGRPIEARRASGTFARDILARLLIDLSWSSSRLEGNTYSRLDTERLIAFGEAAEGKDAREAQMILNHKAAIELLVEGGPGIGLNRPTVLNLHALLSEALMADPEASGRLRHRPVEIGGSVYVPAAVPQIVAEKFSLLIRKAALIKDPFEQAFFLMVQLPYLQPFEDVNKRVSRLAANIPLIQGNLCPLSFVDVPERAYVLGTLAVYELARIDLLRDVFVWAYERSCQRYVVARDSVVEPDLFRMKYRAALSEVIADVIHSGKEPSAPQIRKRAQQLVDPAALDRFVRMTRDEFGRLHQGNVARFRVRPSEYLAWKKRVAPGRIAAARGKGGVRRRR